MTAHVAECGISSATRDVLSQKLRPNLLALKQFETTYILARWIRNLFMDIINKPVRQAVDQRGNQQKRSRIVDSHGAPEQDSSMTPESFLRSHHQSTQPNSGSAQGSSSSTTHNSYSTGEAGPPHTSAPPDDGTYIYETNSYDNSTSPSVIMGNFVPNFITNEFLPGQSGNSNDMSGMNMIDFRSPSTLEYQSLHFLADIGLSGFNIYQ